MILNRFDMLFNDTCSSKFIKEKCVEIKMFNDLREETDETDSNKIDSL